MKVTTRTLLSDFETPVALYHRLMQAAGPDGVSFLLDSADGDTRLARYSMLGLWPRLTLAFRDGVATVTHRDGTVETEPVTNPLQMLQQRLAETFGSDVAADSLPDLPFRVGWVGYLGYAANRYFEAIPQQDEDPYHIPDGCFGLYDVVIVFDHLLRRVIVTALGEDAPLEAVMTLLAEAPVAALPPLALEMPADLLSSEVMFQGVRGPFTKERYCAVVDQAQDYIREGQVFQIVPAQRFSRPVTAPAIDMYRMVQAINPSPYGYLLQFPGFTYLGASPETFVTVKDGEVTLRALAGTRHRGATTEEDEALATALRANEKELAEHRMLVDLGRNDLGRVCQPPSVQVKEIATITRYTHVMHLSTEMTGTLRSDKTAYDMAQSCFPRGTVSGAPKIRAMQLLAQLEPERRGIYSGLVGYFDVSGAMDSAIAIRSVLVKDGWAHVTAGAGVVFDSVPEMEYEETRNKAKSMLSAIHLAELYTRG